jgi:hypothetical protein
MKARCLNVMTYVSPVRQGCALAHIYPYRSGQPVPKDDDILSFMTLTVLLKPPHRMSSHVAIIPPEILCAYLSLPLGFYLPLSGIQLTVSDQKEGILL